MAKGERLIAGGGECAGKKEICVVIPALNEERTIGEVVRGFPKQVFDKPLFVLVVDGKSIDRTVEVAKDAGAHVVVQRTKGKGAAMKEGIKIVDAEIYVFIDADGTYSPSEVGKVLEPIVKGNADMVVGSRFQGKIERGAISLVNNVGNRIFNFIARRSMRAQITDMLSGYRAISGESLHELILFSDQFEIETEMTIEAIAKRLSIADVPISYKRRVIPSKLKPLEDGTKILKSLLFFIMNSRPLLFFSTIGLILVFVGLGPSLLLLYEKLVFGEIYHLPSVVFASLLLITGFLIIVLGLVADLVVNTRRRMEYLLKEALGSKRT